jgi:RNA polymerase sigma factor (sigma-70 family)
VASHRVMAARAMRPDGRGEMTADDLYGKYSEELIRYATALAGPSGAEDVFSAAFARCMERADWSTVTDTRAYLYRSVLNEARAQFRATQRQLRRDAAEAASARVDDASPAVRSEVLDAMRRLDVRERAVVFLTYWADLTVAEVAERVGTSERTVARDLARARRTLEELLS